MPKSVQEKFLQGKKILKIKKGLIGESNTSSSSDSESDKYVKLAFIALQYSDGEKEEKITNFYPKKSVAKKKTYVTSNFILLVYIMVLLFTHIMLVMLEILMLLINIMCGSRKELTMKDPNHFGYLAKLNLFCRFS